MKVINFFGAPGAGKSTAAAGLFYEMKKCWMNAELVTEFAKELVWSGSEHLLSQQHFVFANQEHRLNRLADKVEIAITDSPLLLSSYYKPLHYPDSFSNLVFDFFNTYDNINLFINRSHDYSQLGRVQNEVESDIVALEMKEFLAKNKIKFFEVRAHDATPKFLIHWLVSSGMLKVPDEIEAGILNFQAPPEGWITPVLWEQ